MTDRPHAAFAITLCMVLVFSACAPDPEPSTTGSAAPLSGIRFLAEGDDGPGFARATSPPDYFVFPEDHSAHPEYRTEWWYFTGNVFDRSGNHYGFELTIFRVGAGPASQPRDSGLATDAVWMAHLAVTDTARGEFQLAERLSRGVPGIAGAFPAATAGDDAVVIRVEDFSVAFSDQIVRLRAHDSGFGIELELDGLGRIVPQGDNGLDPKGPEPGNASYYFSAPRLSVAGELVSNGAAAVEVEGTAWMDREWGTSALSPDLAGWDWFALQLDDGRDLMFYRLRRFDGGTSEFSGGSIASANGSITRLGPESVALTALRSWTSPGTGVRYPIEWQLRIPSENLDLRVEPRIDAQEIDATVRYWEGAVSVTGDGASGPVSGVGYLELAGY